MPGAATRSTATPRRAAGATGTPVSACGIARVEREYAFPAQPDTAQISGLVLSQHRKQARASSQASQPAPDRDEKPLAAP